MMVVKGLSIIGLLFLGWFIFMLGGLPLVEGKNLLNPYVDTEMAANYSPEKFDEIVEGMDIEEVVSKIGNPLHKSAGYINERNRNYHYTSDGKLLHVSQSKGKREYDDFAWYRSSVEFNTDGKVVGVNKGWSYD